MLEYYPIPFGHVEVRVDRRPQRPVVRPAGRRRRK
jgi:hypothetical protein